ncbi:MAG: hypothetical protein WB502_09150, partial [Thermoactinomyces sp.]
HPCQNNLHFFLSSPFSPSHKKDPFFASYYTLSFVWKRMGSLYKVYKDGYDAEGKKISVHYFESSSGKVFDVKVKSGWSNLK